MRYCLRLLKTCICCLLFTHAFSQGAEVIGPATVQPGTTVHYTVNWDMTLDPSATVNWYVTGGTISYSDNSNCYVVWNNAPGPGYIEVWESVDGMEGDMDVQIGAQVTLSQDALAVNYGVSSAIICANVNTLDPPSAYQWQSSPDNANWTDIPSAQASCYSPVITTPLMYYRCYATVDGNNYFSEVLTVTLNSLNPGTIALSQQPAYNTQPTITNTAAQGGSCYATDYQYTWEASVDGQPWTVIGTGGNFPGMAVTGKTYIQRTVTCGSVTSASNVIYIVPTYTSVDYENLNYVRTIDVHVAGINTWYQADQLAITSKTESTVYMDGLGRPIQKLAKSASLSGGAWVDLVQPLVYDAAGRTTQKYLPYPTTDNPGKFKSSNVLSEQASFVTNKFGEPSGAPTYSQVQYDNSPLNRVMGVYAPGQSWGGSAIGQTTNYDFNTVDESVHIWSLSYSTTAIPSTTSSAVYATGSLYKLTSTDEKGLQVITYTDFSGNVILKKVQEADAGSNLTNQHGGWECTYYVYDDLNQLRFTITPEVVVYLDANGWGLTQQLVNDLCFVYGYDAKGRTISKKQPGVGETDMVYDQRNRPVFSQDANGKANNQWQGTLYDGLDRVVTTGMLPQNITQASLQSYVDANTGNANITRVTTTSGLANQTYYTRQTGLNTYVASNSITFAATSTTSFVTEAGASFIAFIDPNLGNTVNEVVAIADNPDPSPGSFITLTQTYYDDYSHATKSYTTADNSLFDPSTTAQAEPLPSQPSPQTRGMVTCTKVKVITNPSDLTQGNWLETDSYYDDQGRTIQVLNDNSLGGTDVVTDRYDFQGKLWGSCVKHMAGSPTQFTTVSKNSYDVQGRLTDVSRNFNSTFFKDLASYTYDEYGKMATKVLAPGYTGSGSNQMETLNYNYNIQGWLTGINKDYAQSTNTYDQWSHYFGLYLGYDNADNQFTAPQYNGSITGAMWRSQGDNSERKYDYTYDNVGRFTSGIFNQKKTPADGWSSSDMNLSEYVTYSDGNGNINTMKHLGAVPGMAAGTVVDDLLYTYGSTANPNTNQLSRVDERATFTGNGQLYDFKDGTNAAGSNDYTYDANGNLVQDLNKNITDGAQGGVVYNYLDKPVKITIAGKSMIQYTYDATGVKLTKTVTNLAVTPNTSTTTTYDNEFVYQDGNLQYVLHEEGRMKIITPVNTPQLQLNAGTLGANNVLAGKQGVFEYFVKDQLSSTRMVLTEEVQQESYIATMELSSAADPNLGTDEESLFGQVDPTTGSHANNELFLTRTTTPGTWTGNTSAESVLLTAANTTKKMGPNMILKVSAGDIINAGSQYFYYTSDASGPAFTGVTDALNSLMGALLDSKASALSEMNSGLINTNLGASGSDFSNFINGENSSGLPNTPKAYLNIVFFDEQFNFIAPDPNATGVGSNALQVSSPNDQSASLLLQQKAPRNGWVYIYLSNESNADVYFDNFSVSQVHGAISEENHYYAFGQKIAGICTSAFNKLPNSYKYQGDYSEEEDNTGWNEFDLRMYDPQIGRWTGVDPYDEFASPYVGMGNDPVNNVDPDGGDVGDALGSGLFGTALGWGLIGGAAAAVTEGLAGGNMSQDIRATLSGFAIGAGAYYVDWGQVGNVMGNISMKVGNLAIGWVSSVSAVTIEDVATTLWNIKKGESMTGDQVKELHPKFKDLPLSISRVLSKVERTDEGLEINFTLLGRTMLATIPGTPSVKNGAIVKLERVTWPGDTYQVWHITSSDIQMSYKYSGKASRKGNLDIYLHNNAYTDKIAPGNPSVWRIFKGHWGTKSFDSK